MHAHLQALSQPCMTHSMWQLEVGLTRAAAEQGEMQETLQATQASHQVFATRMRIISAADITRRACLFVSQTVWQAALHRNTELSRQLAKLQGLLDQVCMLAGGLLGRYLASGFSPLPGIWPLAL